MELDKWLDKITEILYPKVCPVCMKITEGGLICENCRKKLKYIRQPYCMKCGKPVESEDALFCSDCRRRKHIYRQGTGIWSYTQEIKNSVYAFKYKNQREFAKTYADELMRHRERIITCWEADVIIPVPIHPRRKKKRGYNQAELLAVELGKRMQLRVDSGLLIRTRYTRPQKELDDKERVKNLENAFILTKNVVKYKKIILVDDIYTTGATIDACARLLKDAGVTDVYFAALCIGNGF